MDFNYMIGFGIGLVVVGVIFVIGTVVNAEIQDAVGFNETNIPTANTISGDFDDSIESTVGLLPILGLVIVAGLIIFAIRGALMGGVGGRA